MRKTKSWFWFNIIKNHKKKSTKIVIKYFYGPYNTLITPAFLKYLN